VYSHVIVGAGSAGCVVAERLSADPSHRVLVLEAGVHYRSAATPPEVSSPNNFEVTLGGEFMWPLEACVTADQGYRQFQQGRGTGGSSSVNNTWALRARPDDVAGWDGIDWADLEAAYVATERDLDFGDASGHGASGPLTISRLDRSRWGPVDHAFAEAAVAAGFPWSHDLNDVEATGAGPIPMTVDGERRVSANDAFLDPAVERPNLEIRDRAFVRRVVFEHARAIGVEVLRDGGVQLVRAEQTILCAGALQTPALLLRSGVGAADELRRGGIEPVVDLPGVGRNLVDHPMFLCLLPLAAGRQLTDARCRQGNCMLRPAGDDLHLACLNLSPRRTEIGAAFVALMHPRSRGRVRLGDRDDAIDARFDCLATADDVERLWSGLEQLVELVASPSFRDVCAGPPLALDGTPLTLDQTARGAWLRRLCMPYRHVAGTCALGSVVDAQHCVTGVDGLRVIDASTLPDATSSNTNLTVIALAHRAARLLVAEAAGR
jgi:choline dehydrogenase-like flavoprotein